MKVKTEKIPGMVDNLLKPFDGLVLELVEQTARAMFYRDALDGDVDLQRINDPFGEIEPETRLEWVHRYNYLVKAIHYLQKEGFVAGGLIEEDE